MYRQTFEDLLKMDNAEELGEILRKLCKGYMEAQVGDIVLCDGFYSYVTNIQHWHPDNPNRPTNAPIRSNLVIVEITTTNGTRWHGYSLSDH